QSAEVRVRIIVLPSLVVFATDDENLRFRSLHQTLSSNIVIRIESVPVQSLVDTAEWNACSNRVRSVGHLFRVRHEAIVHRRVGRNDYRAGFDRVSMFSTHPCRRPVGEIDSFGECKQVRAVSLNGSNYTAEIFEDMELALIGKTKTSACRKWQRSVQQSLRIQTSAS